MERLTTRDRHGRACFEDDGILIRGTNGTFHQKKGMTAHYIHDRFVALDKVIDRLAAYEDTGLEPDEIRRFLQTGAGGLYKKLPCKEGAPVWWIDVDWLPGNGPMFHKISSGKFRYAMLDWNNPVYTSQADAEAALAKMAKEGTTSEKSDRY